MDILIFRTDLKTVERVAIISPLFNNNPTVAEWSVDTQDIDHVLRIVSKGMLTEKEVIRLVTNYGFECEVLPD